MGSFDELTPDRLATLVLRHLSDVGKEVAGYDAEALRIDLIDGSEIGLGNVYYDAVRLSGAGRAARIARFLNLVGGDEYVHLLTWEQARPLLRPILRSATYKQAALDDLLHRKPLVTHEAARFVSRPVFPFVDELVAIDQADSRTVINHSILASWPVSADEVFAAARENLEAIAQPHNPRGNAILSRTDHEGSAYLTSWPLAPGWLASFRQRYAGRRPVVFMPDRDTLIVVPDIPHLLARIYRQVEQQYVDARHRLSPQGYTLDEDNTVVPFDRAGRHEQHRTAVRAGYHLAIREYAAQADWLNEALERDLEFTHYSLKMAIVGEVKLAGTDTRPYTYTVWGKGVDYLLPAADYLMFASSDTDNSAVPICTVPLTAALEITGLTPVPGMSPIRFEARFWPDETMLTQLKRASVAL
ncbi:hypothetical protein ACIBG0_38025 [Nocardia sp. NPDC050630]|uniref:hypothetical protein n=1 Tax=Nocardia sp. NPDC050630 TaxID=3364321 RepID=UPI0037BC6175